jgi:hypothetical protein
MTITLNTAGDVSFNSLNLTSFPTSGNFYFVKNTSYTIGNPGNEYGTICIGPVQIKFGLVSYSSGGTNIVTFTNSFPTSCIIAIGNIYGGATAVSVNLIQASQVIFNNGSTNSSVYWIAIGY